MLILWLMILVIILSDPYYLLLKIQIMEFDKY